MRTAALLLGCAFATKDVDVGTSASRAASRVFRREPWLRRSHRAEDFGLFLLLLLGMIPV